MNESKPTELLPCPFCGASGRVFQLPAKGFRPQGTKITFGVSCSNKECKFYPKSYDFPSERQALKAWNTRTHSPAQAECRYCANDSNYLPAEWNEQVNKWLHHNRDNTGFPCEFPPAQAEWLPIESAPKEGRIILGGEGKSAEGEWWQIDKMWSVDFEPSHWQPRPQPPKDDKQ